MENLVWASINLLLMHIISKVLLAQEKKSASAIALQRALQRPWSNLPLHILDSIANHLGPIDLLSFRGTCKRWRSCAPSEASPLPCHHHPDYHQAKLRTMINNQEDHLWFPELWFLHYGKEEGGLPNCVMFDPCSKKINRSINIPELGKGVVCIGSSGGWLLFHRYSDRSMFFLCPFSRAKIDLPKLPSYLVGESLWYLIASFSSPPTSPDCVVCVFSVVDSGSRLKLVINLLRRGANEWDHRLEYAYFANHPRYDVACATVLNGSNIYIIDNLGSIAVFSLKEREWTFPQFEEGFVFSDLFGLEWRYFCLCKGLTKRKLGLKKYDSLSIRGTVIQDSIEVGLKRCIFGEYYKAQHTDDWDGSLLSLFKHEVSIAGDNDDMPKGEEHHGVWFQPRFFQLPPNYTW